MLKPLIVESLTVDEQCVQQLHQGLEEKGIYYSELVSTLLCHRGMTTVEAAEAFLYPTYEGLYDPYLMKDMNVAVQQIQKHIEAENTICVYGDYDVDGITSTSILVKVLRACGAHAHYYIPDRIQEGYGLNSQALEKIAEQGASLVITVDTGITAVEEVERAKAIGLDIIVTDHHECQEEIPKAHAVLNPKQQACSYPFKNLAGVGVTFKLAQALASLYTLDTDKIMDLLEIVAVGTVADIVPLIDENRVIVALAFQRIHQNIKKQQCNKGLTALLTLVGAHERSLTTGIIGFQVGPRLNAAGRLGDAKRGVELFLTDSEDEAMEIAMALDVENRKRQEMERHIFEEADAIIQETMDPSQCHVLVVASKDWHHGVIGIVASRLMEKYYRPTVLLTIHDGVASGSARSVDGFSIFDGLMNSKDLFLKVGGHDMAAGMSLVEENVDVLREQLNQYAQVQMSSTTLIPKAHVEDILDLSSINVEKIQELACLEPYGAGNREPHFLFRGYVGQRQRMGKEGQHFKMALCQEETQVDVVAFNSPEYYDDVEQHMDVDVIGTLQINTWKNYKKPQIFLKGITYCSEIEQYIQQVLDDVEKIESGKVDEVLDKHSIQCQREICVEIYRILKTHEKIEGWTFDVLQWNTYIQGQERNRNKILQSWLVLHVFQELGLLRIQLIKKGCYQIQMYKGKKVELEKSALYKKIC